MTEATELKKVVKQLQSARTEPVIDFFFCRPMSFAYVVQADVFVFLFVFVAGNLRHPPCNERKLSSERSHLKSRCFFFFFFLHLCHSSFLQESKAGLAVGKLRSHANKAVSDLAKEIVKEWKGEVERAKSKAAPAKQPCTWQFPTQPKLFLSTLY
jgi:hypothetical protein